MASLSQITTATTSVTALANLILVTPQSTVGYQPQRQAAGVNVAISKSYDPAILFHYEGDQSVLLESDITDHYVEDNSAINDQIALRPEIVTTHGFIGELNDVVPIANLFLQHLKSALTVIGVYSPDLTVAAIEAYNEAFFLYQTAANAVNAVVSAWASINGENTQAVIDQNGITDASNQNRQQIAFQRFYGYWKNRTLFTVQTPWAVFENMAIKSCRPIQDADTRMITDFEVTFKMIRFAQLGQVRASPYSYVNFDGRLFQQGSPAVDLGAQSLTTGGPSLGTQLAAI